MRSSLSGTARSHPRSVQGATVPDFFRPAYCIQGLLCDVVTLEDAKKFVITCVREARRCNISTPNANFLRLSRCDTEFRDAVLASDLAVIDGAPLVWLARLLGIAVSDRACGSDLCEALMANDNEQLSAFFFGATDEDGRRVRKRLEESASSLRYAGSLSPGFGSVESMSEPRMLDTINQATPDLLILSVGARKGVLWLRRNEQLLTPPVICNLGATIHFIAGTLRRAPASFRRHGLEWLWRIKEQPRLCTRYARDLTTLISVVVGEILPCLLVRTFYRPSSKQLEEARLQHYRRGGSEILAFTGAWSKDNLTPVRAALTRATGSGSDLVLDLDQLTFLDAAFLGQILIAYGFQRRIRRTFVLHAARRSIRSLLRLHGCGYLLSAGAASSEDHGTASPARQALDQSAPRSARELRERTIASRASPGSRS
jgi:N-acetylglucosaminyldiphosphoundecaprenol N-acetyl-beta-D-mannosaminyltransferase